MSLETGLVPDSRAGWAQDHVYHEDSHHQTPSSGDRTTDHFHLTAIQALVRMEGQPEGPFRGSNTDGDTEAQKNKGNGELHPKVNPRAITEVQAT